MADIGKPSEVQVFYLDDLYVGQRFASSSRASSTRSRFISTRTRRNASLFGGLPASGWHTTALKMRGLVQGGLPIAGGIIGYGGELSWLKPTRPGDTLSVCSEVPRRASL